MATAYWVGNARATAQVVTVTVTAAGVAGNTVTVTINGKVVTYTVQAGDTTALVATGLYNALVAAQSTVPELAELTFGNATASAVTATANVAGVPFAGMTNGYTAAATGAATVTQTTTTANSSPSDVNDIQNWRRSGVAALPQNGDDVVVSDSTVPLLWNLDALAAIQFATYTRWQDFTGTVGLPENNPNGYYEYRPTYFQFVGAPAGTLTMVLGQGDVGSGPTRERYNVGAQRTSLVVLGSGGAEDAYAVRFLGSNVNNTISVVNTSVGVAMLPAETATVASASADGGGTLDLGSGVTFSGALVFTGSAGTINCAPASVAARAGSAVSVTSTGLTYAAVSVETGSTANWISNSTITALTLTVGSIFNKADDLRASTITNLTIDGDSCQVLDPNNVLTITNPITVRNRTVSGPFVFGPNRTVQIV